MKVEKQLKEWVNGNPIHNAERDECCPDFSCCTGKMAEQDVRDRFLKAYQEGDKTVMNLMLKMFIRKAFADKNIYFAGDEELHKQPH